MLSKHEEVFHQCCSYTECALQAGLSLNVCSAPDNMVTPNETIIMVDDILTRGATSEACRDILQQVTGCKRMVGLFIGRTVYT